MAVAGLYETILWLETPGASWVSIIQGLAVPVGTTLLSGPCDCPGSCLTALQTRAGQGISCQPTCGSAALLSFPMRSAFAKAVIFSTIKLRFDIKKNISSRALTDYHFRNFLLPLPQVLWQEALSIRSFFCSSLSIPSKGHWVLFRWDLKLPWLTDSWATMKVNT